MSSKKKPKRIVVIGEAGATPVPSALETLASDLKGGIDSRFWAAMKGILKANVDYLTDVILKDNSLSLEKRDELRRWRNYQEELLMLPETQIRKLQEGIGTPIELDPYFKDFAEILKSHAQPGL